MTRLLKWLQIFVATALLGTTFQVGTGCLGALVHNVNPCGTILVCDPLEYDLLFTHYPDFNVDPTCTIPGLCGPTPFPPTPANGGAVGTTTGTTTGTGLGT